MPETTIYHVTPESNVEAIEENGIRPTPCVIRPMKMESGEYKRLDKGTYVCGSESTMQAYAEQCLHDVRDDMDNGERFVMLKATVDRSRLWKDPEPAGGLTAYICEGPIEDIEIVSVGVLEDPAGNFKFQVAR